VSSELAARHAPEACERFVLHGGDDYELLFTLPAAGAPGLEAELSRTCTLTRIGEIEAGGVVRCLRGGAPAGVTGGGYDHFA
jgi:thiamine-monophosphate kinase